MIHYLWWVAFILIQLDTVNTMFWFIRSKGQLKWWICGYVAFINLVLGLAAGYFNMFEGRL